MKFTFLVFVFSITGNFTEQLQLICSHQPIVALAGDDVILPCHLEPPINADSETVVWTRPDLDPKYIHVHEDGRLNFKNQNPSYFYRTRLFVDELMKGNVSMKIFKVKLSDAGEYQCFLPSMQKEASIQLTVDESRVIGSHEPVNATVGDDVILPCHLQPPADVSTRTVQWRHDRKVVHLYRSGKDVLDDQDENYKDRTSLFHEEMTRGNISLKLSKVTELDEGSYTCQVPKLESQVRRGNVTLIVESEDDGEKTQTNNTTDRPGLGTGDIIGIVIGAVFGVIVLAGIVFVWKKCTNREKNLGDCGRRQDNREDDNQEGHALNDRGDIAEN